jgi:hypothetical protein
MAVSAALEQSARAFCSKYSCNFNFRAFEANVEEFTFLRPIGGWIDVYKRVFEKMYMQALEPALKLRDASFDGETMLDDFEFTLIRPYVKESDREIVHKPYVGMDRVSRIEYLQQLTKRAPSNFVDLYAEKYKSGKLSIEQMYSSLERGSDSRECYVEIAGCVEALENVNKSRSLVWRAFHPFKNLTEKRSSAQMKRALIERTQSSEAVYLEIAASAYDIFDGHKNASENLEHNMLRAIEEMSRTQKMNDAMRESLCIEGLKTSQEGTR